MKVMVIVKATKDSEAGVMPSEELLTAMGNYNEELVEAGIMEAGEGLHPSSKGARVRFSGRGRTVIDGPFAETKELIAGFWIWKVDSMEEAIELLKKCPNPHEEECELEIRPIFTAEDFGEAFTPELREQEASIRAQSLGLKAPRFEDAPEMTIAGINRTYSFEDRMKIPAQWEEFAPSIGSVPGQVGKKSYGVCWNYNPNVGFDYLSGVEVSGASDLPKDFATVQLSAHRYAVFTHTESVSSIAETIDKIWGKWAHESGLPIAQAPCFERYAEEFNPETGMGGIEIWIPLNS
ncbi:MAG: GyrI-like domain-containing protein [Candidatus Omnitrophica bacterium]|nr:GyrI-like domain-containing protein [Candidatus Omnitrophota bacterium]